MIFFRVGLEEVITLPPPNISDMVEVEEVKRIVNLRSRADVESILNHDQVPFYAIRKVCNKHGLEFHEHEFNQIIEESSNGDGEWAGAGPIDYNEAKVIYFYIRTKKPKNVLEVGFASGVSSSLIAKALEAIMPDRDPRQNALKK